MKLLRIVLFLFAFVLAMVLPGWATISSQVNRAGPYTLSALPATISVVFPYQASSDILVLNLGQSGTSNDPPVVLTLNSDYTVTGGGYNASTQMQSGNVVVVSTGAHAVATNDVIIILRNVPVNQGTSFTTGILTAAAIEKAMDKTATISQQLTEASGRSLRFEAGETLDGTLVRTTRASKVVGFDSGGNLTYYAFSGGTILPQSIIGTANQVLVNGSSGSAVTGTATLTTPQDIGISSNVRFGKLGIGVAPGANSDVIITHSLPLLTASASVLVQGALNAPAATDLHPNAFRDTTVYTSTLAADAYASYDTQAQLLGTLGYNHFYGFQARHNFSGSGILGVMAGYTASMTVASGTVTKLRAYYVPNATITGGTVGDYDGLYIDQLTAGTARHAIYVAGNDNIFMAGGQIATSVDLVPINTNARVSVTFNQLTEYGIDIKNKSALATGYMVQFYNSSTVQQGSIQQVDAANIAYNTTSDARLKENLRAFEGSGAIIDRIQPRLYDWKGGTKDRHGFVAQELYEAYPEAVSKGDEGDKIVTPWAIDYGRLTPVLTAEVKDLRRRVAQLEADQAALKFSLWWYALASIAGSILVNHFANRRKNP